MISANRLNGNEDPWGVKAYADGLESIALQTFGVAGVFSKVANEYKDAAARRLEAHDIVTKRVRIRIENVLIAKELKEAQRYVACELHDAGMRHDELSRRPHELDLKESHIKLTYYMRLVSLQVVNAVMQKLQMEGYEREY